MTQQNIPATATPTRSFFVEMLVRDVSLLSAIMDLIDNSVDGALQVRGMEGPLDGLVVNITLGADRFVIRDNCGGIDLATARDKAFRFGRLDLTGSGTVPGSVGLFGVGMKRAMFKLGPKFVVESTSEFSRLRVSVNVNEWKAIDSDSWTFPMKATTFNTAQAIEKRGTEVSVVPLYEGVASQLGNSLFQKEVERAIASNHQSYIERGLTIRLNRKAIVPTNVQFAYVPGYLLPGFALVHSNGVTASVMSGVGPAHAAQDAGWYVYCNGRMVVKADQTNLTGWGAVGATDIPRYHAQFARFRGCAFFDSENPALLPWNTTKDGLDVESPLYRSTVLDMITQMRAVITFLNWLDEELDEPDEDKRVLTQLLARSDYLVPTAIPALPNVGRQLHVERPTPVARGPEMTRVSFWHPKAEVDALKRCLDVRSNKDVGAATLSWYFENECADYASVDE